MSEHFVCKYCEKEFVREDRYLKHQCEKMRRHEEIKTPVGQGAYILYQMWFTTKKKTPPDINSFLNSKYYLPFVSFAKFVKRVKLANAELYIRMMNDKSIMPSHWTRDDMYVYYIEYIDRKVSPHKQAKLTVNLLIKMADAADCEITEAFDLLTAADIIEMIRQRKLSPWVLLKSKKFHTKCAMMSIEEQGIISKLINVTYWTKKFKSHPDINQYMKKLVEEMEL